MMFAQKIRILLIKRKVSLKDLADMLGTSSSNITNKLQRDNFSEKELLEIAKALNCTFDANFILNDTGETV